MNIHVDPPRHFENGAVCYRAILKGDCPLQHSYEHNAITRDEEAQLNWLRSVVVDASAEYDVDLQPSLYDDVDVDALYRASEAANDARFWLRMPAEDAKERAVNLGCAIGKVLIVRSIVSTFLLRMEREGRSIIEGTEQ